MFKTLKDKVTISGITVLTIGVALLIFTFANTYGFLTQSLSILASSDLARTFGEALAPLVLTCIHVMYLGVMTWIGSLLTIRGVSIISQARQTPTTPISEKTTPKEEQKPTLQTKEEVKNEKTKEEIKKPDAKPHEPEIVVLTPEKPMQTPQEQSQTQTK